MDKRLQTFPASKACIEIKTNINIRTIKNDRVDISTPTQAFLQPYYDVK